MTEARHPVSSMTSPPTPAHSRFKALATRISNSESEGLTSNGNNKLKLKPKSKPTFPPQVQISTTNEAIISPITNTPVRTPNGKVKQKNILSSRTRSSHLGNVLATSVSPMPRSPSNTSSNNSDEIRITESQLLLLCLDHLRDLRRSFLFHPDDMELMEGIDADYVTIAIWALSRCFLRPRELRPGASGLEVEEGRDGEADILRTPTNTGLSDSKFNIMSPSPLSSDDTFDNSKEQTRSLQKPRYIYLDRPLEYGNDAHFQREYTHLALVSSSSSSDNCPSLESPPASGIGTLMTSSKEGSSKGTTCKFYNNRSVAISIPPIKEMELEFLYESKPHRSIEDVIKHSSPRKSDDEVDTNDDSSESELVEKSLNDNNDMDSKDPTQWYQYDDAHYSNLHRFYTYDGLGSDPLNLTQICVRGLQHLHARTRSEAEEHLMNDGMFRQFMEAVTRRGFFNVNEEDLDNAPSPLTKDGNERRGKYPRKSKYKNNRPKEKEAWTDIEISKFKMREIEDQRFRKVVSKFRCKIVAQTKEEFSPQKAEEMQSQVQEKRVLVEEDEETVLDHYAIQEKEERHDHSSLKPSSASLVQSSRRLKVLNEEPESFKDNYDKESEIVEEERTPFHRHHHVSNGMNSQIAQNTFSTDNGIPSQTSVSSPSYQITTASPRTISHISSCIINIPSDAVFKSKSKSSTEKDKFNIDLVDADEFKTKGNAQMRGNKLKEAVESYTAALTLMPRGPSSHTYYGNRAAAYLSMKRFSEALDDAQSSIDLQPDYAKAYARMGLAHFLLGEFRGAMDAYQQAVNLDPENETHRSYLEKCRKKYLTVKAKAKTLVMARELEEQEEQEREEKQKQERFRKKNKNRTFHESMDNSQSPNQNIVIDHRTPKRQHHGYSNEGAEETDTEEHQSPMPQTPTHRHTPSPCYDNRNTLVRTGIRAPSPSPGHLHNTPRTRTRKHKSKQQGDVQWEADLLKNEGNSFMSQKQHEQAVTSYSSAIRLCPTGVNSYLYYSNRAAALCYLERYDEAELDSERSVALRPDYGKAHSRLGLSRFFLGNYAGAVDAYETSLVYDPNNESSQNYLEKALSKLEKSRQSEMQDNNISSTPSRATLSKSYGKSVSMDATLYNSSRVDNNNIRSMTTREMPSKFYESYTNADAMLYKGSREDTNNTNSNPSRVAHLNSYGKNQNTDAMLYSGSKRDNSNITSMPLKSYGRNDENRSRMRE